MLKKLSSNIFIYGVTNGVKSLIPFLMLPILTRYLTISQYGELAIIEITLLFLSPFIILNINSAINVQYFKCTKKKLQQYISNALILSLFAFFLVFMLIFFSQYLVASVLNINNTLVILLPVFVLLKIIPTVLLGIFQVTEQSIKFSCFSIGQTLVDFGLSYTLVTIYKLGYIGRLEGVYTAFFLASLIGFFLLYRMGYIGQFTLKYSQQILKFGLPLIPHAIGGTIIAMSDRYFISFFVGNEAVGLYTASYQLAAIMLLIGMTVNKAWTPMLYGLLKSKNKFPIIIKYSIYLASIFTLIGCSIYLSKDLLFNNFLGSGFYLAKEFFGWLLLGFVFQSFYFLVANFFFFEKKTVVLAKITFSGAFFNIILNLYCIKKFGTIGVAYATAITWGLFCITVLIVLLIYYKKHKVWE